MGNFLRGLWRQRGFRTCVWIFIVILALPIVAREYIGWSGERRWAAIQEMLAREGESLDFRKIAPDPVPDERNFCAIPALKGLPLIPDNDDEKSAKDFRRARLMKAGLPKSEKVPQRPSLLWGAMLGRPIDLSAWAQWLRKEGSLPMPPDSGNPARDVLAGLSVHDALLKELAVGLSRPETQWTPAWKARDLPALPAMVTAPHYTPVMGLDQTLCLRTAAAARAGEPGKAHESLQIAVRFNEANMHEPFLIGSLVASSESIMVAGAVWELCDAQAGTAEDFKKLQEALTRVDYHASMLYAERSEMIFGTQTIGYFKRKGTEQFQLLNQSLIEPLTCFLALAPDGWYDGNAAAVAERDFDYFIKPLRDGGFSELLSSQQRLNDFVAKRNDRFPSFHIADWLAEMITPSLFNVGARAAYAQCLVNEAIAACALERYRIEHQAYPDTLEAANRAGEKAIPGDIVSGKPMGYRKTADGRYMLWCVGFDRKDDGGKRVLDPKEPERTKFQYAADYVGDWVWDFPKP